MKTIVITPEIQVNNEIETCNALLKSNVERLHVRKPFTSEEGVRTYISALDQNHLDKVSLHGYHHLADEYKLGGKHFKSSEEVQRSNKITSKSYHSVLELEKDYSTIDYGFLSPVYNSISKPGYTGGFDYHELAKFLRNFNKGSIYALGGICLTKISHLKKLGFDGVALLGTIWSENQLNKRVNKAEAIIDA